MNAKMIADLEKKLRRRKLGSRDLDAIQHGLSEMPLDDIIDLVERQPAKRGAVLVRLLPHGRAAVLFDALDPAHQAEIVEAAL